MKNKLIIVFVSVTVALAAMVSAYEEEGLSSAVCLFEPAPEGYRPGKDNGPGRGLHHTGEDCGRCHRPGGRAEQLVFTAAGTLYRDRSTSTPLVQGEVILQDRDGAVISMTSNRVGNFWTTQPVASDPYTMATTHGHEPFVPLYEEGADGRLIAPADPQDPRSWKYKAWTRNGRFVRPMVSVAGIGGGTAATARMGCSMHHGGVAHRAGALWAGRGATLPSYPAREVSYRKHIYPILRSSCGPCHIPGRTVTAKNTKSDHDDLYPTAVDYSGGLDLMTYEGSAVDAPIYHPTIPMRVIGSETITKVGVQSVVDPENPEESTLLRKTVFGGELHGGGAFWTERSPDYEALRQWIGEGAQKN